MVRGSEQASASSGTTLVGRVTATILSPLLLPYPMGKLCSGKRCWLKSAHWAYVILSCTGQHVSTSLLLSSGHGCDLHATLHQRTSYVPSLLRFTHNPRHSLAHYHLISK